MTNADKPTGQIISIQGADVTRIEYRGEPVVTFAMVDKVHQRPKDTAKRNFDENRERFERGTDFVLVSLAEMRRAFPSAMPERGGGEITLLTRRGYLKLTKPMNDDRAWAVQGEMIDRYFMVDKNERIAAARRVDAREVRLCSDQSVRLAKLAGLTGPHALQAASSRVKKLTGHDMLADLGIAFMAAPQDEKPLIPTQIGERLGELSARAVNQILFANGFQARDEKGEWVPTEKGKQHGAHTIMKERQHSEGVAYQVVWPSSIVETLRGTLVAGAN